MKDGNDSGKLEVSKLGESLGSEGVTEIGSSDGILDVLTLTMGVDEVAVNSEEAERWGKPLGYWVIGCI